MTRRRRAGILLHPTSLPGPFGIGDLGPAVDEFLDWAVSAGQSVWQVLPLTPPGMHGTPYSGLSAFAGNPALISLELLRDEELLRDDELILAPGQPANAAAFGAVEAWKDRLLRMAWDRFQTEAPRELWEALEAFCSAPEQGSWLEDWALFAVLRRRFDAQSWHRWDPELARRDPEALERVRRDEAHELAYHCFVQFLFERQWSRVRSEAAARGIEIMGDLPIYVAYDSADVWANRELFDLDAEGRPREVAGVPPDYFTEDGQLWGNPLYRWDRMETDGFRWWIDRLGANLRLADQVRLDHFRAFAGYWAVPVDHDTAREGRWRDGPGKPLFDALAAALGDLPLVAEDLGDITEDVHALRRDIGLPGMRVLQFGFEPEASLHTPHNVGADTVVYTGTHDNSTALGWFRGLDRESRDRLSVYSGAGPRQVHWTLIRLAYGTASELALVPIQDVLGLGDGARFNTPGQLHGNWRWRLGRGDLTADSAGKLRRLAAVFDRLPEGR